MTEGTGEEATYKPTEHGGLKQDGTPDKRVSSEHGFGKFLYNHTNLQAVIPSALMMLVSKGVPLAMRMMG